ncbi:MAG: response regulator [bacterium]|nr:response regulator [bacterium]
MNIPKGKILIIDDSPSVISMLRLALDASKYDVFVVTSGPKGLEKANLILPDLILLDVLMEEMDGFEVCRRLKDSDSTRDIPIIFLSAMGASFDKVKAFNYGAVDYLTKPIAVEELEVRVNAHLSLFRLQKNLQENNVKLDEKVEEGSKELKKALQLSDSVFNNTHFCIALLDPQFNFIRVNSSYALVGNHKPSFYPGKNYFEVFKGKDNRGIFQEVVESGVPHFGTPFEIKMGRDKTVSYWDWSLEPICSESDTVTNLVLTMLDVTERVAAENKLRESEERYRHLVDNSSDAIFITQDEVIKFPNRKTCELLGYSSRELVGLPFEKVIHPEYKEMEVDRYNRQLAGEVFSVPTNFKMIHREGRIWWAQQNTIRIDWEGRPAVLNSIRDITVLNELESQLRQSQKMEAIGTLAGGIAHDFNNILSVIIGYTDLALANPNERLHVKLDAIYKAGLRAKDLVEQILFFSRRKEFERKPIYIQQLLKESTKLLRASIPTTIEIIPDICQGAKQVLADPTQIQQIVMNLCTNSYHAMKDSGGTLAIVLKNVTAGSEKSALDLNLKAGEYVFLSISDTGSGIPQDILDRIFDPYFTTKREGEGTGLGLAVVHGIVKKHDGFISVKSTAGVGTTFDIYLPAVEKVVDESKPFHSQVPPDGKEHILLVDDEKEMIGVLASMLRSFGYKVTDFTNVMDALELFRSQPENFDLVITDMTMPLMTGDTFAQQLMQITPEIPVFICTGFSHKIDEVKAKNLGIKRFIQKPVGSTELAISIREVLDEGK